MEVLSQVLPQDVQILDAVVPLSLTARTTKLTDLSRVTITNTTSGSLNYTLTNGSDVILANLGAFPVDPGVPVDLEFRAPLRCVGGFKDLASGAGLVVNIYGRRHTSWVMVNGFVQDSST